MKSIFIVDAASANLAADLNAIAKKEKVSLRFTPFATPERFFQELEQSQPDLVLLHHHWPGARVSQILQRIFDVDDTIRVVVFTGQSPNINELIECVRFGAADYWTERGKLDYIVVFRKIEEYCHNSTWTMKSLRSPSGPLAQLLLEAENSVEERRNLEGLVEALKAQVREVRGQEHRAMKAAITSAAKFLVNTSVLTGAFVAVNTFTAVGVWPSLGLIAVIAIFVLFLEGKLTEALVKSKSGSIKLTAK